MSVKKLVSWSVHTLLSTRPGNPSRPCGLVNVDLSKGLAHIGYGGRGHTVVREQLVLSCVLQCCLHRREHEMHLAYLVGSQDCAAPGWVSLCNNLPINFTSENVEPDERINKIVCDVLLCRSACVAVCLSVCPVGIGRQ